METAAIGRDKTCLIGVAHLYPFHQIVILRIVHAKGGLHDQSTLWLDKLCVQISPMGMERTNPIRDIQVVPFALISDDIDCPAQGIITQTGRNHPFVNLDALNQIHRQIGQRDTRTFRRERNAINKVTHRIARHTINREVEIRTHSTLFSHTNTRRTVHHLIQVTYGIDQRFDIQGIHGKGTLTNLLALRFAQHLHHIQ